MIVTVHYMWLVQDYNVQFQIFHIPK